MRKLILLTAFLCAMICVSTAAAQSLLNQTHFTPCNFKNYHEPVSLNFGNGCRFVGTKHTSTNNGKVISVTYSGTAYCSDNGRIISLPSGYAFDKDLQPTNGLFWEIEPNGEVYRVDRRNGQDVSRVREYRKYVIENNCIVFPKTAEELQAEAAAAATYGGGSTSSSSSSGTSRSSHSATCRGCNGSGRCQHCGGTGKVWVNNHWIKCSLCHNTGRCQSCAGVGKIY